MINRKIYGIMACDPNGVIGKEGTLPWHCPEDLEHFHHTTLNQIVIMGYSTFLTLPKTFLEPRISIVFTHKHNLTIEYDHFVFVKSLSEFLSLNLPESKKLFMIGGGELCRLFIENHLISEFILTEMKDSYPGDTTIPISEIKKWDHCLIREASTFRIRNYKPN